MLFTETTNISAHIVKLQQKSQEKGATFYVHPVELIILL